MTTQDALEEVREALTFTTSTEIRDKGLEAVNVIAQALQEAAADKRALEKAVLSRHGLCPGACQIKGKLSPWSLGANDEECLACWTATYLRAGGEE